MKIKLIKYILGLLAFTFVFVGCNKNEDVPSTVASNKQDILIFKTAEDFRTTLNKVNSMKPEERIEFEESNGFKSFGTICDDFYESINPDKFKSEKEALSFITSNSQFIQILNHSDSSKCCVTKEFNNPTRYLMNENKIYIIGNTVFKQFDEGCISTDISNIETLKASKDFMSLKSNPSFKIINTSNKAPIQKMTNLNVGNYFYDWDENIGWKDYWYRIEIYLETTPLFENYNTYRYTSCIIKNYRYSIGIWWSRTLINTYNVTLYTTDYFNEPFNYNHSGTNETFSSMSMPWEPYFIAGGSVNEQPFFTYVNYSANNDEGCSVAHTY